MAQAKVADKAKRPARGGRRTGQGGSSTTSEVSARQRGRPVGGGKEPEQAKEALLDAAERSLRKHGYRGSTMEVVAREAGYTRTIIYRHFATRDHLDKALLQRTTLRHVSTIVARLDEKATLDEIIVEAMVVVATELVKDPLYAVFSEQTEAGTVARMLVNAEPFMDFVVPLVDEWVVRDKKFFRKGIRTVDVVRFLTASSMGLLLGIGPDLKDSEEVRRYVAAFILPAIMAKPPPLQDVFTQK